MAHSKLQNHFTIEEAIGRMTLSAIAHPFDVAKILIQLGYEPLPAKPTITFLFKTQRMQYPNVFGYLAYIRKEDGFLGLYRGFRYKMLYTLINGFVHVNLTEILKQYEKEQDSDNEDEVVAETQGAAVVRRDPLKKPTIKELFDQLSRETFCKFITLSISYPLQLIVIRSIAQFVGREQIYDSLGSAVTDIYTKGGLTGFYAGFVPRFFGDIFVLWSSHGLIFLVKQFVEGDNAVQGYLAACVNFIVTSFMYPFNVVSTVMAVNGPEANSLVASAISPDFNHDWTAAWQHLSSLGQIKRGSSMFWRYKAGVMQDKFIRPLKRE